MAVLGNPELRLYASEGASSEPSETWFVQEALRPRPRGLLPEAYSRAWFERVELLRHGRHGEWMPRLLEFVKHPDETVLGLGDGLGTDWAAYARHGARVIVATSSAEQLSLVRRNFEARGLAGQFLLTAGELPLPSASIDVVNLNGLWSGCPGLEEWTGEIFRVLRPGGKVLAVLPAHYDARYWAAIFFPWRRWHRSRPDDRCHAGFTSRVLMQRFERFRDHRIHKRHLRRSELPHVWRLMPLSILERFMGRVLILKAFKPLTVVTSVSVAA